MRRNPFFCSSSHNTISTFMVLEEPWHNTSLSFVMRHDKPIDFADWSEYWSEALFQGEVADKNGNFKLCILKIYDSEGRYHYVWQNFLLEKKTVTSGKVLNAKIFWKELACLKNKSTTWWNGLQRWTLAGTHMNGYLSITKLDKHLHLRFGHE